MKLTIQDGAYEQLKNAAYTDILSVKETQDILGICRISVYKLIESQQLSAFRIGRVYMIPKQAITDFLSKQGEGAEQI